MDQNDNILDLYFEEQLSNLITIKNFLKKAIEVLKAGVQEENES